jgi:hypothetical protein
MTTDPITIPKRTMVLNKNQSPGFKIAQGYWDLPSLDDQSVKDAVAPYISGSLSEDSEYIYLIPKESPKSPKDPKDLPQASGSPQNLWQRLTSKLSGSKS